MGYLYGDGFLGTRASFFIDLIAIEMVLLPFLLLVAIMFAKKRYYTLHSSVQLLLFIVTFFAFVALQYGIHSFNDFNKLVELSSFDSDLSFYLYLLHTTVALVTVVLWFSTLQFAKADRKRRALPGLYSPNHKRMGRITSTWILFSVLTTLALYWVLFVA